MKAACIGVIAALCSVGCHGKAVEELPPAAITAVDSYEGLVAVSGVVNDAGTGARFSKEVIMLLHEEGRCEADFEEQGLENFGRLAPDDVVLVSADISRVDAAFLETFADAIGSEKGAMPCPTAVVIKQRSKIGELQYTKHASVPNKKAAAIHSGVMRTQAAHVGVVNEYTFPINVYYSWWGAPEKPHSLNIKPNRESWMQTYRSTELVARTLDGQELQRYQVKGHGLFTVANRNCNAEDCGIIERPAEVVLDEQELNARSKNDKYRTENNRAQPAGLPKFTEVGFAKVTVPDDVWDMLLTYYRENKDRPKKEMWGTGNVYTNNLEAPSYMVNLPETGPLKPAIFNGIRPILEEWSGVQLHQTACYGIRVYTNGSWLANHVDTRATHAVSVIINVDQEVSDPWPLMIFDHAGNSHNITMAPRDMVLYESATCVHGRPSTFNGKFYANMFVHYKPVDDDKWISDEKWVKQNR